MQRTGTKRGPSRRGRKRRKSGALLPQVLRTGGLIAGLTIVAAGVLEPERVSALLRDVPGASKILPAPVPRPVAMVGMVRPMPLCGGGRRISCVVDGDTFWVAGEKIRLVGIDAPEIRGACAFERDLAQRATRRLSEILSDEQFRVERSGTDRFGRTLATVVTPRGEAGDILVREGLAREWRGRKEEWCARST